jgi:hypothetical protein
LVDSCSSPSGPVSTAGCHPLFTSLISAETTSYWSHTHQNQSSRSHSVESIEGSLSSPALYVVSSTTTYIAWCVNTASVVLRSSVFVPRTESSCDPLSTQGLSSLLLSRPQRRLTLLHHTNDLPRGQCLRPRTPLETRNPCDPFIVNTGCPLRSTAPVVLYMTSIGLLQCALRTSAAHIESLLTPVLETTFDCSYVPSPLHPASDSPQCEYPLSYTSASTPLTSQDGSNRLSINRQSASNPSVSIKLSSATSQCP